MAECPENRVADGVNGSLNDSTGTDEDLYRLHRAVFRGDVSETKDLLNDRNVNQEDVHG